MRVLSKLAAADIFISYARGDRSSYAHNLMSALAEHKLSCFIDKLEPKIDPNLPDFIKQKIKASKMLVVVGSEKAANSEAIEEEIRQYLSTNRTALVVIRFDDKVYQARWYPLIQGISLEPENNPNALTTGKPSSSVVNSIAEQFSYTRRYQRLRRATMIVASVLGLLVIFGFAASIFAGWKALELKESTAEVARKQEDLEALEIRRIENAKKLYNSRAQVQVGTEPVSLAFDGKNVWVANHDDNTVQSVDQVTGVTSTAIQLGRAPGAISFYTGKLWIANPQSKSLQIVDPSTSQITKTLELNTGSSLLFDGSRLWAGLDQTVDAFDPDKSSRVKTLEVGINRKQLCFDGKRLWVVSGKGKPGELAIDNALEAFDTSTGNLLASLSQKVSALVFDGERLWIAESDGNTVRPVDVNSFTVGSPIGVGRSPELLAFDGKRLWIGYNESKNLQYIRIRD